MYTLANRIDHFDYSVFVLNVHSKGAWLCLSMLYMLFVFYIMFKYLWLQLDPTLRGFSRRGAIIPSPTVWPSILFGRRAVWRKSAAFVGALPGSLCLGTSPNRNVLMMTWVRVCSSSHECFWWVAQFSTDHWDFTFWPWSTDRLSLCSDGVM
jgi:hypothetical protein